MCSSISTSVTVASVVATFVMRCGEASGARIVAGLAEVDLVAFPAGAALGRVPGIAVIGRADPYLCWAGDLSPPARSPPACLR
jgi:hypothetical protein